MSDKPLESGQEGGEDKLKPPSTTGGQQTPAEYTRPSTVEAEAIAKAVQPLLQTWLDDQLTRKLQSEKDRRINQVERKLETMQGALGRFTELVKGGMSPDQAQQQLRVESAIEYVESLRQQTGEGGGSAQSFPPAAGKPEQAIDEAKGLLSEAGLDSDPEWVQMVSKGFSDAHEAVKAAANLIIRRAIKGQKVNLAAAIQPGGGALPEENLEKAYQKEIAAARGQGATAGRTIREKYRALGLDV